MPPIPGTSGGVAKDKNHVAPLPPKKRVRVSSPSNWDFISPPNSSSSNSNLGLLASTTENDLLKNDDGDTRSPLTSTPSSSPSDEHPIQSSCYTSCLTSNEKTEEVSSTRMTVIKKNLSEDELREKAAAIAEQQTSSSMVHQSAILKNAGLSDGLRDLITGKKEKEEFIPPTGGNAENQEGQQNMDQGQSCGTYHQDDVHFNQERIFSSFDFPVQHEQQSTMQGMNPVAFEQPVPFDAVNYNGSLPVTERQEVPFKQANFHCALPAPTPDLPSFGALNLVNRGQIPVDSESDEVANEERRLEAVRVNEALGTLHHSIDSVRQAFNALYALNYQMTAPTAMHVFGRIVDSMISFYANYMRSDER